MGQDTTKVEQGNRQSGGDGSRVRESRGRESRVGDTRVRTASNGKPPKSNSKVKDSSSRDQLIKSVLMSHGGEIIEHGENEFDGYKQVGKFPSGKISSSRQIDYTEESMSIRKSNLLSKPEDMS